MWRPRNPASLPMWLGFTGTIGCALTGWTLPACLIAIVTGILFVRAYRNAALTPKRVAATMGAVMAFGAATLLAADTLWGMGLAGALVLTTAGWAASTLNTFANYCLGCEMHHRWL